MPSAASATGDNIHSNSFSDDNVALPSSSSSSASLRVPERRLSASRQQLQQQQGGPPPPHSPHQRRRKSAGIALDSIGGGGSSFSNLEDFIDPDILTDKMGLVELEPSHHHPHQSSSSSSQHQQHQLNASFSNLAPVTERMSEETLEDVHAFSDVVVRGTRSSIAMGSSGEDVVLLEALDEGGEEDN
jgi:hypothetical protein